MSKDLVTQFADIQITETPSAVTPVADRPVADRPVAVTDVTETQVIFLVGRMNPPTPGHIHGLCIPFLHEVRKKAISILTSRDIDFSPDQSLIELVQLANLVPRIFLTNTTNDRRISYMQVENRGLYKRVKGIVSNKNDADPDNGIFYVKDKNLENPLIPEDKKLFVIRMILNALDVSRFLENSDIVVSERDLQYWIVCQTSGPEHWCAQMGPVSAINCGLKLSKSGKYENLFFFMGEDEDPKEMDRRMKFCLQSDIENDEGEKVNCITVPRINIDTVEQIADSNISMSASKIRMLMADKQVDQVIDLYDGLLTPTYVCELIHKVNIGLRLQPPFDPDAFEICKTRAMPPTPIRSSARIRGVMAAPGMYSDKTTGYYWDNKKTSSNTATPKKGGTRKQKRKRPKKRYSRKIY